LDKANKRRVRRAGEGENEEGILCKRKQPTSKQANKPNKNNGPPQRSAQNNNNINNNNKKTKTNDQVIDDIYLLFQL